MESSENTLFESSPLCFDRTDTTVCGGNTTKNT